MEKTDIICLDAEFADSQEILGLAVVDGTGRVVYHSYFKPELARRWPDSQRVHHISPAMVRDKPSLRSCLPAIQAIIDKAKVIVGYALSNDTNHLAEQGVEHLNNKPTIDVRDLYWTVRGRHNGVDLMAVPSLARCAEELGVDLPADKAHAADADTIATLQVYDRLMEEYGGTPEEFMAEFDELYREYVRLNAHGYAYLLRKPGLGDILKVWKEPHEPREQVLAVVELPNRFKGEYEIRKRLAKRRTSPAAPVYRLQRADIEWMGTYTNEYVEGEAEWFRALLRHREELAL